jgi:hypothetical protein
MKRKNILLLLLVIIFSVANLPAQENDQVKKISVSLGDGMSLKFGGYFRTDAFLDTRNNNYSLIDGLIFVMPSAKNPDANGSDLNADANMNFSAALTRFNATFTGPKLGRFQLSSFFEFDFSNVDTKTVLFRHAWLKFSEKNSEWLIGRSWHPFLGPVTPTVVGAAWGAPFQPFSRGEQIRYNYSSGWLRLSAAAFMQSAFPSYGPNGKSNLYQRNSDMPELTGLAYYAKGSTVFGASVDLKSLCPRTSYAVGSATYKTNEKLTTVSAAVFAQKQCGLFTAKAQGLYIQNMSEALLQGGYAVKAVKANGDVEYTPSQSLNAWANFTYGKKYQAGLFLGYVKNLGLKDNAVGTYYGYGNNIGSLYRVSPSFIYTAGRFQFSVEEELTGAAYGTYDPADKGKVKDARMVSNLRTLLSATMFF